MAKYTNVTERLINLSDGSQCVPGQASEVSDDMASNEGFKALIDAGEIVAGEVPADKLDEARAAWKAKAAQQAQGMPQSQPAQPTSAQQPRPQPTTQSPQPAQPAQDQKK